MEDFLGKLNKLTYEFSSLTQEQLKEQADQILNNAKKLVPVKMNRSCRMLPPEDYDRPIDKYLDATLGKKSFR